MDPSASDLEWSLDPSASGDALGPGASDKAWIEVRRDALDLEKVARK